MFRLRLVVSMCVLRMNKLCILRIRFWWISIWSLGNNEKDEIIKKIHLDLLYSILIIPFRRVNRNEKKHISTVAKKKSDANVKFLNLEFCLNVISFIGRNAFFLFQSTLALFHKIHWNCIRGVFKRRWKIYDAA